MNTYGAVLPGAVSLARIPAGPSREARKRVVWFDYYRKCGNASKTCRHFGIARNTFHKRKRRYSPYSLSSLENLSRRPSKFRHSPIPIEQIFLVKKLRTEYPHYSKYKIAVLLRRDHNVALSNLYRRQDHQETQSVFQAQIPAEEKEIYRKACRRTQAFAP
jgi:hypothetical protein